MLMLRLSLLLSVFINSIPTSDDPCSSYVAIDDYRRSTSYEALVDPICDITLSEGWYRFISKAGGEMPRSAPPYRRCGTTYPIWHNGALPENGGEHESKGCVVSLLNNCSSEYPIKVKNCGAYVIYRLRQTAGCPQAYCAGTNSPCLRNESSINGFTPGCKVVPKVDLKVTISAHRVNGSRASATLIHTLLEFRCGLIEPVNSADYEYQVTWLRENEVIHSSDFVRFLEMSTTHLQEKHFNDTTFGYNLTCGVHIKFPSNGGFSPYTYDSMYVGFKTNKQRYEVKENDTININIHLTVPFGCTALVDEIETKCVLSIRGLIPSYQDNTECGKQTTEFVNTCAVPFKYNTWSETGSLKVFGTVDNLENIADRVTYIRLQAEHYIPHPVWSFAKNKDIQILIKDADKTISRKKCSVRTDPNFETFDGKCFSYQGAGEFVIYKHTTRPFSVHAMLTSCAFTGGCTCGVAVRNGRNVFIANYCNEITTHYVSGRRTTNNYVKAHICDDTSMFIQNEGERYYKVTLPSGTNITMESRERKKQTFIHMLTIYPSLADFGSTVGLCGILDGDTPNDYHNRDKTLTDEKNFISSWRVDRESKESLFSNKFESDTETGELKRYCKCVENEQTMKCTNDVTLDEDCATESVRAKFYTTCASKRDKRSTEFRRSVEPEITIDEYSLVYHADYKDEPPVAKWMNGWNEEKAKSFCEEKIKNTQAAQVCGQILSSFDETIDIAIQECVSDIKNSGDAEMADATFSSVVDECKNDALKIEKLTNTASTSGNASKSLLDDILDVTCQNNCSNAGKCLKGICTCKEGNGGSDCSRQIRMPPEVFQPSTAANCKTDQKSCFDFTIPGRGFLEYNLTCRTRSFKIQRNGIHTSDMVIDFPGTYVADFACICTVPPRRRRRSNSAGEVMAVGYNISVSNDGKNFSEDVTVIAFDSLCFNCSIHEMNCTTVDTCPDQIPKATNDDKEGGIVALSIAIAFLGGFAVIGIAVLVIFKVKIRKRSKTEPYLFSGIHRSDNQRNPHYDNERESITYVTGWS